MWIFWLVSYLLQKHYRSVISYFVGCQASVNMNTGGIFFAICRWIVNCLFFVDSTNLEKLYVYSHEPHPENLDGPDPAPHDPTMLQLRTKYYGFDLRDDVGTISWTTPS
jgi:hypothetical protein